MIYNQDFFEKTILKIESLFPLQAEKILLMLSDWEKISKNNLDIDEKLLKFCTVLWIFADFWATDEAIFSRPIRHELEKNDISQDFIEQVVETINWVIFPFTPEYKILTPTQKVLKPLYQKYF